MKHFLMFFIFLSIIFVVSNSMATPKAPTEIAGFHLGGNVKEYPDAENDNFLNEVVVREWHGFRKVKLFYGTCAKPDEIIRISLKFENSSKQFFEKLMNEYKKRFGEPTKWKGDAFKILHVWKWVFLDENNRRVNLILQHNLRDQNETSGNLVKLSYPERIEEEHQCFVDQLETSKSRKEKEQPKQSKKIDWEYMIPR